VSCVVLFFAKQLVLDPSNCCPTNLFTVLQCLDTSLIYWEKSFSHLIRMDIRQYLRALLCLGEHFS
jgi:hypothetical protein